MKALHLTAYGNPAQNLRMVEVFGTKRAVSAGEALVRMEYAPIAYSTSFSERSLPLKSEAIFCLWR